MKWNRKMTMGPQVFKNGVDFKMFAPHCKSLAVKIDSKIFPLKKEKNGYFSAFIKNIKPGARYHYVLNGEKILPDPLSHYQPEGPYGPSEIVDPESFKWIKRHKKIKKCEVIIYELHIGTFTKEGTWKAASKKLNFLKKLGITVIEMMPISECPGAFNWGYDGVNFFAPSHNYGTPDDLKAFIDAAHKLDISVILDVVYNHFGPGGNFWPEYAGEVFFKKKETEWGAAINYAHPDVRAFFIENAGYWIREFRFDGLRIDACHAIYDESKPHILKEIVKKVYQEGGSYVTCENEEQQVAMIEEHTLDAMWNEDFHHAAYARLSGYKEAYISDYVGSPQEFISMAKHNFLYQGQWYSWQKQGRGTVSMGFSPSQFINFLANHDQIANLEKLNYKDKNYLVLSALLLLSPQTPLLFQGQEFGSKRPFHYFYDHNPKLARKISQGRRKFCAQFKEKQDHAPDPSLKTTFTQSKLDWKIDKTLLKNFVELIALRKSDPVFSHFKDVKVDGAVLSSDVFLLRYFSRFGSRLLLFNLGKEHTLHPQSDPLLAPPKNHSWQLLWANGEPIKNKLKKHSVTVFKASDHG